MPKKKLQFINTSELALRTFNKFSEFQDKAAANLLRFAQNQKESLNNNTAELRDYQIPCIEKIGEAIAEDKSYGYLVLPTGFGKTRTFLSAIKAMNKGVKVPTLVVMPSTELINQEADELDKVNKGPFKIGRNLSSAKYYSKATSDEKKRCNDADVVFITWQSLMSQFDKDPQDRTIDLDRFGAIILDEAHTLLSEKLSAIVESFKQKNKLILGFTATDKFDSTRQRGALRKVKQLLHNKIMKVNQQEAIEKDMLSPCANIIVSVQESFSPSELRKIKDNENYTDADLAGLFAKHKEINNIAIDIYRNYQTKAGDSLFGKKAIAFCAGVEHAKQVAEQFNKELEDDPLVKLKRLEIGPSYRVAACVSGVSEKERRELIDAFKRGEISILTGAEVLNVGFDDPDVEIKFGIAPINSRIKEIQTTGRILRKSASIPNKIAYNFNFEYGIKQKFFKDFIGGEYRLGTDTTDFSAAELEGINFSRKYIKADYKLCDSDEKLQAARDERTRNSINNIKEKLNPNEEGLDEEDVALEFLEMLPELENILSDLTKNIISKNLVQRINTERQTIREVRERRSRANNNNSRSRSRDEASQLITNINSIITDFAKSVSDPNSQEAKALSSNTNNNNNAKDSGDILTSLYNAFTRLQRLVTKLERRIAEQNSQPNTTSPERRNNRSPTNREVGSPKEGKKEVEALSLDQIVTLCNNVINASARLQERFSERATSTDRQNEESDEELHDPLAEIERELFDLTSSSQIDIQNPPSIPESKMEIEGDEAEQWLNRGKKAYESSKWREAIECYKKAVEFKPKFTTAYAEMGVAYHALKELSNATKCFYKVLELEPNIASQHILGTIQLKLLQAKFHFDNGYKLAEKGKYQEAIKSFDKALEIDQGYEDAWFHKGHALARQKKYSLSNDCYDKVLEIDPNNPATVGNKIHNLNKLKEYNSAFKLFDIGIKISKHKEDSALLWNNKGDTYLGLKDFNNALECYEKALTLNANYKSALRGKGNVYWAQNNIEEAKKWFEKVLQIDPNSRSAKAALEKLKDVQVSGVPQIPINASQNNYADLMLASGKDYLRQKNWKTAYDKFANVTQMRKFYTEKQKAEAYIGMGKAQIKLKEYEEADTSFQTALTLDPKNIYALLGRAKVASKANEKKRAEGFVNLALEIDPNNVDALLEKGYLYNDHFFSEKFREEAIQCFFKVEGLVKNNKKPYLKALIGRAEALSEYTNVYKLAEAANLLSHAISREPNNKRAWLARGKVCIKLNQIDYARKWFEKALSIDPNYEKAKDALASIKKMSFISTSMPQTVPQPIASISNSVSLAAINQIDELIKMGNGHLDKEEWDAAFKTFDQAIGLCKSNEEKLATSYNPFREMRKKAHFGLGNAANMLKKYDVAIQSFTNALIIDKEYKEAYFGLGIAHLELRDYSKAESAMKLALRIDNNFTEAKNMLEHIRNIIPSKPQQTSTVSAPTLSAEEVEKLLKEGKQFLTEKKWSEAFNRFEQANKNDSKSIEALIGAGKALIKQSKWNDANKYFMKAYELGPRNEKEWFEVGKGLKRTPGNETTVGIAVECLKKVLDVNPDFKEALYLLGIKSNFYKPTKQESRKYFNRANKIDKNYKKAWYGLGHTGHDSNSFNVLQEAKKQFGKALEIDPNYKAALLELGQVHQKLHNHDEAIKCYNKVIKLDPNYRSGYAYTLKSNTLLQVENSYVKDVLIAEWIELGKIFPRFKNNSRGYECFIEAAKLAPNNVEIYKHMYNLLQMSKDLSWYQDDKKMLVHWNFVAENLARLNEKDLAINCYEQVVKLNPLDVQAKSRLSILKGTTQPTSQTNNVTTLIALGKQLFKNHLFTEAYETFDSATKADANNADAWVGKGCVLRNQSKFEEAIICFNTAITLAHQDKRAPIYIMKSFALEDAIKANNRSPYNVKNVWSVLANNLAKVSNDDKATSRASFCLNKALEFDSKDEALLKLKDLIEEKRANTVAPMEIEEVAPSTVVSSGSATSANKRAYIDLSKGESPNKRSRGM
jgi:tetratricopeptide (TPR) repeat protein